MNALSEFTQTLKHFIKAQGCSAILTFIKETLFHPWLPTTWYDEQLKETPQLRLQWE